MRTLYKTIPTTAAFLAVLTSPAYAQLTNNGATISVEANVVAASVPLSLTAPSTLDMGDITIPVSATNTCIYGQTSDGTRVTDATGVFGSNPEPSICDASLPFMIAQVTCAPNLNLNLTRTVAQNAMASSAGLSFELISAYSGNGDFLPLSGATDIIPCPASGTADIYTGYTLIVPGTAQPYSGAVGQVTLDVAY